MHSVSFVAATTRDIPVDSRCAAISCDFNAARDSTAATIAATGGWKKYAVSFRDGEEGCAS